MAQGSINRISLSSVDDTALSVEEFERTLYEAYLHDIVPLITAIEVYDNEFPVEVLNEIRSIFTHLARCKVADGGTSISDNLIKAERHLKRLSFDCYKYTAAIHAIRLGNFLDAYTPKVLAGVNDGAFLVELNAVLAKADESIIQAKTLEAEGDEAAALESYAASVEAYTELDILISSSRDSIAHAQSLYGAFEESVEKSGKRGYVVGVVGAAIGVIGIVVGLIGIFF